MSIADQNPPRARRGFAAMNPERRREIARRGREVRRAGVHPARIRMTADGEGKPGRERSDFLFRAR